MSEQNEPSQRLAGTERRLSRVYRVTVNRFFLIAFAGFVGVMLLVSYKQGLFVPRTSIYFYAAEALGISKGMQIRLYGIPIGSIRNMQLSDRGVKVELSIVNDFLPHIPKGSQAKLTRESYVGSANLQIVPGADRTRAAQPIQAGDEIEFVAGRNVTEMIDDIKTQVTPLIDDLRRMLADLDHPDSDYRKASAATRALLEQLPVTHQETRKLLRDADRAVLAAEATLGSVARVSAQAERQLPVLAGKAATTLDSLSETAAQVREATRKNGDALHETLLQVPALVRRSTDMVRESTDLVREGSDLVRDGGEVVTGARNAWPVRHLVEKPSMRTLPLDSFESAAAGRSLPVAPAQP